MRLLILTIFLNCFFFSQNFANAKDSDAQIPKQFFGMHVQDALHTKWPSAKFGTLRIWDARLNWFYLQPEVGKWNFTKLDEYVELAIKKDVEIIMTLGMTPKWASARPFEKSGYGPGYAAEPKDIRAWRHYVMMLGYRYKGKIKHYEIWNEPYLKMFYSGSPKKMAEMTKVAYQELKRIDPEIIIISPTVDLQKLSWFESYLKEGGGDYFDIVAGHFYVSYGEHDKPLSKWVKNLRNLLSKYDVHDVPIWNTESGRYFKNTDNTATEIPKGLKRTVLDETTATADILKAHLISWTLGIKRYCWYSWEGTNLGFTNPSDKSIKKYAAKAYTDVVKLLSGANVQPCEFKDELWQCKITTASDENGVIVWSVNDVKREFEIAKPLPYKNFIKFDGNNQTFSIKKGQRMSINNIPVMLY